MKYRVNKIEIREQEYKEAEAKREKRRSLEMKEYWENCVTNQNRTVFTL